MDIVMASAASIELPISLVTRYVAHLAGLQIEIERFEGLLSMTEAEDGGPREQIRAIAHKLAGTAGSYGFPDLGHTASALERAIRANAEGKNRDLMLSLTAFREELRKAVKNHPVQAA